MCREVDESSQATKKKQKKSVPPTPEVINTPPTTIPPPVQDNDIILPSHTTGISGDPLNILLLDEFDDLSLSDIDQR